MNSTLKLPNHELTLTRLIQATPEKVFRAWTEPALLKRWFAPLPWTVAAVETDVRPGGAHLIVLRSPEGTEFPNHGVYLEVSPPGRLVFTDAYLRDWEPSAKPFITVVLTFEPVDDQTTRYTARVRHWTAADREHHEKMGFHQGWGRCADQLTALVESL